MVIEITYDALVYPYMSYTPKRSSAMTRLFRTLFLGFAAFLVFQLITLYLSWPKQMMLGAVSIVLGLAVNRSSKSRTITLMLMLVSMTATLRYGWWRVNLLIDFFTDGTNHRFSFDAAFMLILILAEAYTVVVMVLGYMQTAWPLQRKPIPMPADESLWPHVDVLVPTYNEPLTLVRYTALAAINIDYPPDKLHVYILDDGTRADFAEFASQSGVGYITRERHNHAKAGNINHALTMMNSPFVTIFDCDHVPTRSFLQMTLGWMLADKNLAMLQTPHHFYSPDPFERNLLQYKTIPSEAELFYGIVQDGNDFWNATFFCGSCALIRRVALDEVGGIAVETVTEDAHTSLRLQKLGYNTAYINIPQAAGLATETLAAHVGQRIRWARGMIQILRTDNPLLARGLKFSQRLCYLNAMIHFLYAVPRLVFLCAPLVYMLLGRTIIPGYWVAILAYSLPHLILSNLTNSRIQARYRHSFWNEIYEAVLAPYILMPTLLALINPKLGKFNVTDKGSTLAATRFDHKIAAPTEWLLLLNFIGLLVAPYRIFIKDPHHPGTVMMNLVWIVFNMVILGVAAAVAHEQKQRRGSVRIEAKVPIRMILANGRKLQTVTLDMSVGGTAVKLPHNSQMAIGDRLRMIFPEQTADAEIAASVVGLTPSEARLEFSLTTIAEQETLTRVLYSRADAWLVSVETKEEDRPLRSLGRVIRLSFTGFYQIVRSLFPKKQPIVSRKALPSTVSILLLCLLGGRLGAQTPPSQSIASPAPAIEPASSDDNSSDSAAAQQVLLRLKDLGVAHGIEMRGPHSYYSVRFTLPNTLVPRSAALKLRYEFDSILDPRTTSLKTTLNGTTISTLTPLAGSQPGNGMSEAEITVPGDQLVRNNTLTFEFTGNRVLQRQGQAGATILGRIGVDSTLQISGDRLHLENDLSQLPSPIFDSEVQSPTIIPFSFPAPPSSRDLEAAGVVASWFGIVATSRPVRFAASIGDIPKGDVVLFSDHRAALPAALQIPAGTGPMLALRDNPSDPFGSILILAGDDEEQLLTVARTLSLTRKATLTTPAQGLALSGDTVAIPDLIMPLVRGKGDAPRWLPLASTAPLASCSAKDALQTGDSSVIPVYFHVPPDLNYGEHQNLKMHLHYRYNALPLAAGSALRVRLNGVLINEADLIPGKGFTEAERLILVPVAALRPFGNTLMFSFDFTSANRAANSSSGALKGEILCDSSLDLDGLGLWTRMPNLELFANAGFPFTQTADLAETTVILPAAPTPSEIGLYLHLMGHFGSQTGYPVLRVTVAGPNIVLNNAQDYLVLGTIGNQPAFNSLADSLPVSLEPDGLRVTQKQTDLGFLRNTLRHWWSQLIRTPEVATFPGSDTGATDALVEEIESPAAASRSFVIVALNNDAAADSFASVLYDRSQSGDISGSASLLRNGKFESYPLGGETYHVGSISWFGMMRIWLAQYFIFLLLVVTALSFVVAVLIHQWLAARARARLQLAELVEAGR